jgi:hypothetical protein
VSEMELRVYDADPERVERIRARCVAALERRRRETERRGARGPVWRTWLEPAVAVGVSILYLADAVARALAAVR